MEKIHTILRKWGKILKEREKKFYPKSTQENTSFFAPIPSQSDNSYLSVNRPTLSNLPSGTWSNIYLLIFSPNKLKDKRRKIYIGIKPQEMIGNEIFFW